MIAAGPYGRLLRLPDVRQLVLSSIVGRIPLGLSPLGLVLFLQERATSIADAGIAAACYVLGLAAMAPVIGRTVDRFGPRRVLLACIAVHPTALVGLTVVALLPASRAWIFAFAIVAGTSLPPITVCARALYPRLVADASLQRTAYSLDSAIIEGIFILGPMLAAAFAALGAEVGALWLAAACALTGGIAFCNADPVREWAPRSAAVAISGKNPLRDKHLLGVLAAALLFAFAFGAFEIAVVGIAAERAVAAAAGVILALASLGSVLGVLAFGAHSWTLNAGRQFQLLLALMAAGLVGLAAIDNVLVFGAVVMFAAAPMAPVIAANSLLVLRVTPKDRIAEAFTWASTALLGGISAGTAAGGTLVERYSPSVALIAAAAATVLAAVAADPAARRLAPAKAGQTTP